MPGIEALLDEEYNTSRSLSLDRAPQMLSFTADDPIVQKRDSLALVLGLSKARVIDVHRGAASRLYLDFVQGRLQQKWALDADDSVSLKVKGVLERSRVLVLISLV